MSQTNPSKEVVIVGATGVVGQACLELMPVFEMSYAEVRLVGSEKSAGKVLSYGGEDIQIEALCEDVFKGAKYAIFCAGNKVSEQWAEKAVNAGCRVIDCSSFFRQREDVPLVVPEINGELLDGDARIIASPNCTTTIALMGLGEVHRQYRLKRLIACSYQSASGAGKRGMEALEAEIRGEVHVESPFTEPLHCNAIAQIGEIDSEGVSEEEGKMEREMRKILGAPDLKVSASCIRVPTERCHGVALHAEFEQAVDIEGVINLLNSSQYIEYADGYNGVRATPLGCARSLKCLVSRVRRDKVFDNGIAMWVVGDQIYKGAAQNALEILKALKEAPVCT